MTTVEMKVDALARLVLGITAEEREEASQELRKLMKAQAETQPTDAEDIIGEILLELGAPDHLIGYPYVIKAIMLVMENRSYINNITMGLYPELAARFGTTAGRVERAIRHVIEVAWMRGDPDVLNKYFGNTVSADKGKPTNGEFIARMANIIRLRLKH